MLNVSFLKPVLEDAHDEGGETLRLRLSNASGAAVSDAEGTGTIVEGEWE